MTHSPQARQELIEEGAREDPLRELPGRSAAAARVGFLVDGQAYFGALVESLRQARSSVLVLGWDLDSRMVLRRGEAEEQDGLTFGQLLQQIRDERPELEVRLLNWSYPVLYAKGRQPLPTINPDWDLGPRIFYRLDGQHPQGAAHHQKIVVVDGRVAFVGGMDITHGRWDTSDHHDDEPRRQTSTGKSYPPYHDVQMVVDGKAALEVSRIAVNRWRWATDETLPAEVPLDAGHDPWPASVTPNLRDVSVTVSITMPEFKGRAEAREIEPLYLQAIESAQESIYIENQYLTAEPICDALVEKLADDNGPDVVIILPTLPTGWIEQVAMVPLQQEAIRRLREADSHDRLGVYCPFGEQGGKAPVKIHSKLMVVDDRFATVGSANLNHRSMGFDSECNLSVRVAPGDAETKAIQRFRLGLLADHFGIDLEEIEREQQASGGMKAMVEQYRKRTEQLLVYEESSGTLPVPVDPEQVRQLDPDSPLSIDLTMDDFMDLDGSGESSRGILRLALILAFILALVLVWRLSPLGEMLDKEGLMQLASNLENSSLLPFVLLAAYLVGGLVMFPVVVLILVTAALLPTWTALGVSLAGSMGSAALGYFAGKLVGRDTVTRLMGERMNPLKKRMRRHGIWATALLRIVPVAPFTVINVTAGASHLSFRSYIVGTFLGMFWGLAALTLFGSGIREAFMRFDPLKLGLLAGGVIVLFAIGYLIKRRFNRLEADQQSDQEENTDPDA